MKKIKLLTLFAVVGSLLFASCTDLSVENQNAPDSQRALSDPDDLESLLGTQYLLWWNGTQKNYPGMTLAVMSGNSTSTWGNFGMFELGAVPRTAFTNNPAYADIGMASVIWSNMYAAISSVNDGLAALKDPEFGMEAHIGAERARRMEAVGYFLQGVSYGAIANHYDQAILVDEDTDLLELAANLEFATYEEVLAFAVERLQMAIDVASANTFTLPASWIPLEGGDALNNVELANLARAYMVRFIVSNARTPAERDAINWGNVASVANAVLTANPSFFNNSWDAFTVHADGEFWWSRTHSLMQDATWHRAFYPLIGRYDVSGRFQDWLAIPVNDVNSERREFIVDSADLRVTGRNADGDPDGTVIGTDFALAAAGNFPAERGMWRRSRHRAYRNIEMYQNGYVGPMQHIRRAEINMYRAEALLRQNPGTVSQGVADLINYTRVDRGGLDPITTGSSWDYAFNSMMYEFYIETYATHAGLHYYNVRSQGNYRGESYGGMWSGTMYHFPIPANELELMLMDSYTFGGDAGGAVASMNNAVSGNSSMKPAVRRAIRNAGANSPDAPQLR